MFVVKFTDKLTGSWSYQHKDLYQNMGTFDLFSSDMCFKSIEEANAHIDHCLKYPDCGRWRDDVDKSYFEIVEVFPLPCMKNIYVPRETLCRFK